MRRNRRWRSRVAVAALVCTSASGCAQANDVSNDSSRVHAAGDSVPGNAHIDLVGAGATFPYPLYAQWFNAYATRTAVRINYHSVGSAVGIQQLLEGQVDFAASDVPMNGDELRRATSPVAQIPTVLGAVAITYNLPELTKPLRLSGDVLADIFLGRVTTWNDPRIQRLNGHVTLPSRAILVVHRDDGSGTTYIFSDFLTTVSRAWAQGPGRGKSVTWPVGIRGTGNEGVSALVRERLGSIGYVEVGYARINRLPVTHLRNQSGQFVSPMPFEIASAAANSVANAQWSLYFTDAQRQSLVNVPGEHTYPIVAYTWLLVSPRALGPDKTRHIVDFVKWALQDGGEMASGSGYVPLPARTSERVLDLLDSLPSSASGIRKN